MEKFTAIVLAGGTGKRMHSHIHKQYLTLAGKPVLYYALKAFEESDITDIILVTGADEEAYCKRKIIDKYHIGKVKAIVPGGVERYHSVYAGLCAAEGADYVLIHDGARPLVSADIIKRSMQAVKEYRACVAGMPVKDTIKIADEDGYAKLTPERSKVWQIQTPQSFSYPLVYEAYRKMLADEDSAITDDAMVVERMTNQPVKLIEGNYRNIKITTPEDMERAAALIGEACRCAVLVKGGHLVSDAVDYLYQGGVGHWFRSERIDNPNTPGTGCTLSSAIACNLADGRTLAKSIENAKKYLTGALAAGLDLGHGSGPLEHTYAL